jgi:hypothetical protein
MSGPFTSLVMSLLNKAGEAVELGKAYQDVENVLEETS